MSDKYFNLWEIRYSKDQIRWLIPILPALRLGQYPQRISDTGYFDPQISGKGGTPKTPFARAVEIAAEIDARIEACKLDGLMLEFLYSGDSEDMMMVMAHIGIMMSLSVYQVRDRVKAALNFVKGYRRKRCSYQDFCNHRRVK